MLRRTWLKRSAGISMAAGVGWPLSFLDPRESEGLPVFTLRNPGCRCCDGWADHLRENGFQVHMHDSADLHAVKARLGVPEEVAGCHTAVVEGYVVEGHVPANLIRRLLEEKPAVTGISAPGMPPGSPGMEAPDAPPYEVVAFGPDVNGGQYVYETVVPESR